MKIRAGVLLGLAFAIGILPAWAEKPLKDTASLRASIITWSTTRLRLKEILAMESG